MPPLVQIERMGAKPVYYVPAKSVVNFDSGFRHKLLCDGLTFSAGSACQYSCSFCYVPDGEAIPSHSEIIIRRAGVIAALKHQLTLRGKPRFTDPKDQRVIYMSPLVDVAPNPTLCEETVEACKVILDLTPWHIRMLSKSSFLPRIATALRNYPGAKRRIIYGFSTGTLDDGLARSFEQGTALVSKRLQSLHWLQDRGFRTFGMICPSLPQASLDAYLDFSEALCRAIRIEQCEHVWAEVMNVRGESFTRTVAALAAGGYTTEAGLLEDVYKNKSRWENYARETFMAHAHFIPSNQLRFLQYVTAASRGWWEANQSKGAVLLGPAVSR